MECLALNQRRLQRGIARKSGMLRQLQQALEQQRLVLLAQPIIGFRGERYQEIVLALRDDQGALLPADRFLPIADEFGLRATIDLPQSHLSHRLAYAPRSIVGLSRRHWRLSPTIVTPWQGSAWRFRCPAPR